MDGRDSSPSTGRTGIAAICAHLRELERQQGMTTCPVLVGLDMTMKDAVSQVRSRLRSLDEWAHDTGGAAELWRFEYLVQGWRSDAIFLLRPRAPSSDPEQPITIGRSGDCDVCIPEEWISSVHAAVIRDASVGSKRDHYYITDMESRHGVLINGEPVPADKLRHLGQNDLVTLGRTSLLFVDAYMQRLLVRDA